jgi:hypothetical protein
MPNRPNNIDDIADILPLETLVEWSRKLDAIVVQILSKCVIEPEVTISKSTLALALIHHRIGRTHRAAILLVENQFPSEAAILVTTEFELLLDLLFIARDVDRRATQWFEHSNTRDTPWTVPAKIKDVFPTKLSAAKGVYETLCAIKHGNPTAGELGLYVPKDSQVIESDEQEDDLARKALPYFVVALSAYQLLWATFEFMDAIGCTASESDMEHLGLLKDYFAQVIHKTLDAPEFVEFFKSKSMSTELFLEW